MTWSIIQGNALALPLPNESVDLIITSPPYFALRSYRDGDEHYEGQLGSEPTPKDFLEALWAATAEMKRVLKPTGSMFINLGDKYAGGGGGIPAKSLMGLPWRYAIGCIDDLNLILRAEMVWSKPNGLPESVTDRVRRSHEQWFHFTKQGRYFAAMDEIREASLIIFDAPQNGTKRLAAAMNAKEHHRYDERTNNPLGKLPGSVWQVPSEPLIIPEAIQRHYDLPDHFAAFPQEWPRRIILGWSPSGICVECGEGRAPVVARERPDDFDWELAAIEYTRSNSGRGSPRGIQTGDSSTLKQSEKILRTITGYACSCPNTDAPTRPAVVLDPFAGTGTVVGVANALGRNGIGVELSNDYCRLARWRIANSGHFAKSVNRRNAELQGKLAV